MVATIIREALVSALSQRVASVLSVIIVAGMCATVILTTGRAVGAERAVLESIDSTGTRSIVVRADADAGLDTSVLQRIANLEGIEWAGAFEPAMDVTNSAFPDGGKVPVRLLWADGVAAVGIPSAAAVPERTGWATALALEQLGMADKAGAVITREGDEYLVAGEIEAPDFLTFLEPLVVVPQVANNAEPRAVGVLVVIARSPELVAALAEAVSSVLAVDDPGTVQVTTSEALAELRGLVQGQLGGFGRTLVISAFALTAALVAATMYGLVMLRRKDFGRRRALGASQALIVALVLTQVATLSVVGAVVGSAAAAIALTMSGDPLPGPDFFLAVDVLAVVVGAVAGFLPAVAAARRDPLYELRVP